MRILFRRPISAATLLTAALVFASGAFMAWSAACCLDGEIFRSLPHAAQTFTISVKGSARTPHGTGASIDHLFVDGRRARYANLRFTGNWERGWAWKPPTADLQARIRDGTGRWLVSGIPWSTRWTVNEIPAGATASLSFEARKAAFLLDRRGHCGRITIYAGTSAVWSDPCSRFTGSERYLAIDLPGPSSAPRWPLVMGLALFLALAAVAQPWVNDRRLGSWLLFYLLVLHSLTWLSSSTGVVSDSLAEIPVLGGILGGYPGYFAPGYPLLVGLGHWLAPDSAGLAITLLQHLMMIAALWWCFRILQRCVGTPLAFLTCLIAGAAAPTLFYPQTLESENPAIFGMVGALYFAARYRDGGKSLDGVAGGGLLGVAGLSRAVPFAAGIPAIFAIMSGLRPPGAKLRRVGLIIGMAGVLLALPAVWFKARSGSFTLASSFGLHLYDRAVSGQGLFDESGPATGRLLRLASPLTAGELRSLQLAPGRHHRLQDILMSKGLTGRQVNSLLGRVAWEGIRSAPFAFIVYSIRQAWTQYFDNPTGMITWWANPGAKSANEFETAPLLGVHAGALLWRHEVDRQFGVLWKCVSILALASVFTFWTVADPTLFLGLLLMSLGYLMGLSLLELEVPRYTAAVVPLVFALAAGPLYAATSFFSHCKRSRASNERG